MSDVTLRTEVLKTAQSLVSTHGITAHMTKWNAAVLTREVTDSMNSLRYDFHLDPNVNSWTPTNPSVILVVAYDPLRETRQNEDGDTVVDHVRRVTITASATEMTLDTVKKRESMLSMVTLLCEMLESTLPPTVTTVSETSAAREDRLKRAAEQVVGDMIYKNLPSSLFLGLRRGGAGKNATLRDTYLTAAGHYPPRGVYRFRRVRKVDSRGRQKDVVYYTLQVHPVSDPLTPPVVTVRRVEEP